MTQLPFIHLVDDDEPVRAAFVYALQAVGFSVVTYIDAADFLSRAQQEHGVLISDVRMPTMSGIELTRHLRKAGSLIPIILVTGHTDGDLKMEATSAGADTMLAKPFELAEVVAEIARLTGRSGDSLSSLCTPRC